MDIHTRSAGTGTATAFLTTGNIDAIPVWTTSCSPAVDPPPDYGLTPCAVTDGATPPWSPDMSGHVVKEASRQITGGTDRWSIPLTPAQHAKLAADGRLLVSYETPQNKVQAFDIRLR